jgi:NitT/TauT family transport system permease protein
METFQQPRAMNLPRTALGFLGLIAFFAGWALLARHLASDILLPQPAVVVEALGDLFHNGTLQRDILASLGRVFSGFLLAAAVAIPLALILASFAPARAVVMPIVTLLRPIPPIAWIPLAILWFGLGEASSGFITAVAAFFPIFLSSYSGAISVERDHINAARCLGAGTAAVVLRVCLPSALPGIWTGLRIGLGQAWMAVVAAELIAARSGLGFLIQISRLNLETAHVLVGMLVIGISGALMTTTVGLLERLATPWRTTLESR